MTPPTEPATAGAHEAPAWTVPLRDWWRVLVKRRWIIATTLVLSATLAVLYSLLAIPTYRARAVIQIKPQGESVLTSEQVSAVDPSYTGSYQDFYQTQPLILRSRKVVELAVDRLDLPNRPEFLSRKPRPVDRLRDALKAWIFGSDEPAAPRQRAVDFVSDSLVVEPVRFTQLVEIAFVDRSPELARDVVNAIAEAYIQFDFSSWHATTNVAREFLTREVVRVRAEIAELERRMQEYGRREQLIAMSGGSQDISEQALAELNAAYVSALGRLGLAEANLRAIRDAPDDSLPHVAGSGLIQNMKQELARIERQHGQLAERFKPGWPALAQAREELDRARERLDLEIAAVARQARDAARTEYERARAEVANVERRLADQKVEVRRVKQAAIEYAGLQTAIDTKRRVLNDLVTRQSETDSSVRLSDSDKQNIRFIDRAEGASKAGPRLTRNVILALIFGMFAGVGLALLLDVLDNSIKTEADIMRVAGLAVLGHVPTFQPLRVVAGDGESSPGPLLIPELASHFDSRSGFAESFKNLRTTLLLACPERPPRYIVVSSCEPADGKSTVSVNLAVALVQLGRRVLLVDADLRRPRLQRVLGLSTEAGLSSLLTGNATVDDVIQESEIPGLPAVCCGPIPPNPTELVGSPLLTSFLHELTERRGFDHVILDTAPLTAFSDPVTLALKADATVLVVRAGKTAQHTLAHAMARLTRARVNVVGAVLNAVDERDQHYYYGYTYHNRGGEPRTARGRGRMLNALRSRVGQRRRAR